MPALSKITKSKEVMKNAFYVWLPSINKCSNLGPYLVYFVSDTDIFHLKVDILRQRVGNYNQPNRNKCILRDTCVSQPDRHLCLSNY